MSYEEASNPPNPAILPEQLHVMEAFIYDYTDQGRASDGFVTALADNHRIAEEQSRNRMVGEVIITAAAIGSYTRSPEELVPTDNIFIRKMHEEFGLTPRAMGAFSSMQNRFALRPDNTLNVSDALGAGLDTLQSIQESDGEDVTNARLAFLASAYGATRDPALRAAIARDLLRS